MRGGQFELTHPAKGTTMIPTRLHCTRSICFVKSPCFVGPRVVFVPCKFGEAWRFKSSSEFIRICVSPWKGLLRFDADWIGTDLELGPHAGGAIQSRWIAEH